MNRLASRFRPHGGFTLVELLVALTVFSVGLLAMASTSAVIMQTMAGAEARTVASDIAEARFEKIAAIACANRSANGVTTTITTRGITEAWTRFPLARADDVVVSVTFTSGHQLRTETFRSYLPC
jgi:prepilin-type N-terminal cleavage/methylation domain-containing protein